MTYWLAILFFLTCTFTTSSVWAHGDSSHVLGTVTEATDDHIVVETPKGKSVSIAIHAETSFQKNGISTKEARPQVGDRLVGDVAKDGENLVGKEIRFATPKSK